MTVIRVSPDDLQAAAPSFKSFVVADLNITITSVANTLSVTLGSVSVLGPFANEIEEIITGIRGQLECLDNELNRTYIGLQSAASHYEGLDNKLANVFSQIDASLGTFLGYKHPSTAPSTVSAGEAFAIIGGVALLVGGVAIAIASGGTAIPAELAAGADFAVWEEELSANAEATNAPDLPGTLVGGGA